MATHARFAAVAFLVAAVAACDGAASRDLSRTASAASAIPAATSARAVPRLVDLGAGKCVPCKAMAPILDQLRVDYAGRMEVVFIDVWKDPAAGAPYAIRVIPTQIFYGADGRELARHQGYMSREEILAQWKAVGVRL